MLKSDLIKFFILYSYTGIYSKQYIHTHNNSSSGFYLTLILSSIADCGKCFIYAPHLLWQQKQNRLPHTHPNPTSLLCNFTWHTHKHNSDTYSLALQLIAHTRTVTLGTLTYTNLFFSTKELNLTLSAGRCWSLPIYWTKNKNEYIYNNKHSFLTGIQALALETEPFILLATIPFQCQSQQLHIQQSSF